MCLGVPGKIVELYEKDGTRMGKVDFGGVIKEVCFETLPEAKLADYTMVHVGFAISLLSEEDAVETLKLFDEINLGSDTEELM